MAEIRDRRHRVLTSDITRGSRLVRLLTAAMALCLLFATARVQGAGAETTHRFLRSVTLPVGNIQPIGVDPSGNIIVFSRENQTIDKFSPSGAPVDFSALGTNVIDGKGGFNCPAVPSDCDRTPFPEGLGPNVEWHPAEIRADMNQSTEGPTAGYIYVTANVEIEPGRFQGHVVAFDAAGNYKGEIDETQETPDNSFLEPTRVVNVSPGGTVYLMHDDNGFLRNIDKFQPVDENPAHDIFVGQLRKDSNGPGLNEGGMDGGAVADDEYVYVSHGGGSPRWEKYDGSGFTLPAGNAMPINLSPDSCEDCATAGPWDNGGIDEENNNYPYDTVALDPGTHDVYLLDDYTGMIVEWAADNRRVGQMFGGPEILNPLSDTTGYTRTMAFDTTGSSTDGRIYIQSSKYKLAVFGPPAPVPDILDLQAVPTHTGGNVTATVDLAHGPKATNCHIEWAEEPGPGQPIFYSGSTPCQPEAPYTEEQTQVGADLNGLQTERSYRVRVVVKNLNGTSRSQSVKLHPPAVLSVNTEPATGVTRTSAVLNGSLNADGLPTEYYFQYGIDTHYRNRTAAASAGEANTATEVAPVEIANLQSGRPYHFRLVATNSYGTTYGPDQTFSAASAPIISGLRTTDVAETSVTLHARINPGGFDTTYHFEYGTTPEYGQNVPATETNIGSGSEPVELSEHIANLQPGVTYHFRVVATNSWGGAASEDSTFDFFPPACPNEYVRQLTRSSYLPDCRAYELVSPGDAGGVSLLPGNVIHDTPFLNFTFLGPHLNIPEPNPGTATNPARFSFVAEGGAVNGTNPPNSLVDYYTSTRTSQGWVTRYWGLKGNETAFAGAPQCSLNGNVCIDYHLPDVAFHLDPTDVGSLAPYVWTADGKSLGRWPTNFNVVKNAEEYIGDDKPSPDFSHYVFSSRNIAFAQGGLTHAPGSVYDNDIANATLEVVSKDENGNDIGQDFGTSTESIRIPAISTDGSHILMSTEGGFFGSHLYMRVNDAVTYEITPPGKRGTFIGMTNDGTKIFFSSREQLTPDDTDFYGTDIWMWEQATDTLTRITQGNGQGNGEECEQEEGFEGFRCSVIPITTERPDLDDQVASQSGDIYFFSPEQLDPENPGVYNQKNLYVYHDGKVQYVATLDPGTSLNRLQISPDGKHVAFLTAARLTNYDNHGWREMYTFDRETGAVRCASCDPTGEPPVVRGPLVEGLFTGSSPESYKFPNGDVLASESGRFMSNDGRVAFTTSQPLVKADTNGLMDVYEYVNGRAQLISSGTAQRDKFPGALLFPAEYVGLEAMSEDGTDLYFSTIDTLAPGDVNGDFVKFYDARTNGGFAVPQAHLPCVAADECHGEGETLGAPVPQIGTGAMLGAGTQGAGGRSPHTKRPKRHRRKRGRRHHGGLRR